MIRFTLFDFSVRGGYEQWRTFSENQRKLTGCHLRIDFRGGSSMHSIACLVGLVFLAIFALIAIPILILMAKLVGMVIIGGVVALLVLGIWKLFDLAEPNYRPY
jgi:hypothetical protein